MMPCAQPDTGCESQFLEVYACVRRCVHAFVLLDSRCKRQAVVTATSVQGPSADVLTMLLKLLCSDVHSVKLSTLPLKHKPGRQDVQC